PHWKATFGSLAAPERSRHWTRCRSRKEPIPPCAMLNLSSPFVECLHYRLKLRVPRPELEKARSSGLKPEALGL
ncbi:hypothetical protein LEMLEM_LOCUS22873, partial [Lemmus lemmus]